MRVALRWMEGSLFFRGVTWMLNFIGAFFGGSSIVRLFVADLDDTRLKHSRFVQIVEGLLNRFPKLTFPAIRLPNTLARWLDGSLILRTAASFAFPGWCLLVILVAAPFLPTMVLAGLLVLALAAAWLMHRFTLDWVSVPLLLFVIVTLFCGYTSLMPSSSIPIALLTTVLMLAYPLLHACVRTRPQLDALFFLFVVSAALTGLIGLYQYLTKQVDMTWVDKTLFDDLTLRVSSSFGNPNVYGAYLLLAIPLCAALAVYAKRPLYKLAALGVTGLLLLNLALTYSRGCYLALAAAAFVFVLMTEKRLVVFLSAGLVFAPFVMPDSMLKRLLSITNLADSSTSYRLSIWQASLRIVKDFWMTGLGQGIDAYNVVYPFYAFSTVTAPHAHNLFLQITVETGIVGIIVFMAVLACFFRTQAMFMRRTPSPSHKILSAAMTSAVIGFLFQGIFDHVFYNYRVMLLFFLYIGMACAVTRLLPTTEDSRV